MRPELGVEPGPQLGEVERAERATLQVPAPDTGSLLADLEAFLGATFAATADGTTVALLRSLMAQSLQDPTAADLLRRFVWVRRGVLGGLFARGQQRGELGPDADLDLLVDQVFGVVWYRLLVGHAPLTAAIGRRLAGALARSDRAV